jgi:hypothetical protein
LPTAILIKEKNDGTNQERWFEARFCRDGSGQAAGNREQGRQSQPRRRAPAELEPLSPLRLEGQASASIARPALFHWRRFRLRNTDRRFALSSRGLSD